MSVTLDDLQPFVGKAVILHKIKDDNTLEQIEGEIKMATVAGVPFKPKGSAPIELLTVAQIEEVVLAPVKAKAVSKKHLAVIELGQSRQHLADRHGISLKWCKDASEQEAFDYHAGLDHSDLGHDHEKKDKPDEREAALADGAPVESA
jgi:hypothetical protein